MWRGRRRGCLACSRHATTVPYCGADAIHHAWHHPGLDFDRSRHGAEQEILRSFMVGWSTRQPPSY